jgi:phosphoribosylaminoimidazole-succinocarboxamide synthase
LDYSSVTETNLPLPVFRKGKVRDLYDLNDKLLIVATDRISAFDVVLPNGIPSKGESLNRLSTYWFEKTENIVLNHLLEVVDPRTVLVRKTEPIRIEFVVRGYLYGSAWESYRKGKPVSGNILPKGLKKAEKLPNPIFTPTTKAETGHDEEMTEPDVVKKLGEARADEIKNCCLTIYEAASRRAESKGMIIADTKMEFGVLDDEIVLIDELLTPDSSRFWAIEEYVAGRNQQSFDKQYLRDFLISTGWNKEPPAPQLPENVILETSKKYVEAYELLTGRNF